MIDEIQKRAILREILKSKSFVNSKLNAKLLTYLVECSITNHTPTEYSIAIDVFKKDSSFNPSEDTLVRVSVYNLRKKLERYYQNMGAKTKVRLKIPKGHYEVEFFNYSKETLFKKFSNPYFVFIPIIVLLSIIILYLLFNQSSNYQNTDKQINKSSLVNQFFSGYFNSKNSKIISLGDDFIYFSDFSEFNTTYIRKMYRNSNINKEKDFEKFKSEDSTRENLKKLPFSFFNQAAVWPLPYLTRLFHSFDTEYLIKSTTALTSNDLKTNDIFFLGSFWTLGILDHVLSDLGIYYNIIGNEQLKIKNSHNMDTTLVFRRDGVAAFDHIDYSLFIKIPGPNNNIIFLLVSFYATGSVGTIKYLTNEETLKNVKAKLELEYDDIPPYYLLLFKSTGYNREVLSTELLQLKQISSEDIVW